MSDAPVRVLLVDDDEDDFIITRDLLAKIKDHQYRLDWVNSYDAALTAIERREHDICLLDYRLGERTGLELLRETKTFPARPPMILLTGQGDREIDLEATKAGAADYLIKGQINSDKLERAIRYAIQGKRAEECLRRERDLITRIMETSPVGIVVADRTGQVVFANHQAEKVLSLTQEVIEKRSYSVLGWQPIDQDGNPLAKQPLPLKQVLDAGEIVNDIRHAISLSGRHTLLSTNATPLFDTAGTIDGMVVTVEDITERSALEAQLRQSQKMEVVGQLAAGVAHDINNVLTVILGHTGLLLGSTPPGSNSVKSLKEISAASERAARFVRQLLVFSRKQISQSRILDLNTVVRQMENMLVRMLGEDITLDFRCADRLPSIEADTGMIEQILMNLAVNSRDAMPNGGKLTITTADTEIRPETLRHNREARAGHFVILTVTDTGCGMDHHILPRIFEPFFTTKETGKGTGLGLATVYGIVKQHRGWLEVQSEPGVGSTFKIFLPAAEKTDPAAGDSVRKPEPVCGGKETILIVEDEPGLLALVRHILQQYHYHVLVAASGDEALRVWERQQGRVDLLLTDMIMPGGMTGKKLAEQLRCRKSDLKIIYTSGYSPELMGKDFAQGDSTFLSKPYVPSQLAQLVRTCLDAPTRRQPAASSGQTAPTMLSV
jgi:two-component system cell cycle sensor histidine kinase/response regulator CckA